MLLKSDPGMLFALEAVQAKGTLAALCHSTKPSARADRRIPLAAAVPDAIEIPGTRVFTLYAFLWIPAGPRVPVDHPIHLLFTRQRWPHDRARRYDCRYTPSQRRTTFFTASPTVVRAPVTLDV
jgi:hypothetical protein